MQLRFCLLVIFFSLSLTSCLDSGEVSVSSNEDFSTQGLTLTGDTVIPDGGVGKITLRLNYFPSTAVTVRVKTFDGSAISTLNADFHAFDDTVVIPAGQKEKSVSLVTFNHFTDTDTDKTLTVKIVSATGATILTDEMTVTIQANVAGPFLDKVSKLALGLYHSCALLQSGRVKCWGGSLMAQTGKITTTSLPVEVVTDTGAIDITSYSKNTCITYSDGSVNCWGDNTYYNISDTLGAGYTLPVKTLPSTADVKQYATGNDFSCHITNTGDIKCRGNHTYGQTGCTAILGGNYSTCVVTPPVLTAATQIDSGAYHTCAVMSDESVICWGSNWHGVLGSGIIGSSYGTPITSGLTAGSGAVQVTTGETHTCALIDDGTVQCWGSNLYNQLGQAATSGDTMTPTSVVGLPETVTKVVAGAYHTCALGTSGKVYCWGYNGNGNVGTGSISNSSVVTEISNAPGIASDIEVGAYHSCLIYNGDAYCWGPATNSEISTRESTYFNRPSDPFMFAKTVVKKILSNPDETGKASTICAQLPDNSLTCTGDNTYGQLGMSSISPSSYTTFAVPTLSDLISDFVSGINHSCALLLNGGVECWGRNNLNQIASGSVTTKEDPPLAPSGLPTTIVQLSSGTNHNCALTVSGAIYCWGDGTYGQSGSCSASTAPTLVVGPTSVASIVTGGNTSCAVATDGKVKCWGDNSYAQLGRGDTWTSCDTTPVNALFTSGTPESVQQLSLGHRHGCAIMANNQLKCWGSDDYGQIGSGLEEIGTKLNPFRITSMDNARQVNASKYHTCAIDSSSGVKCWGYNPGGLTGVYDTSDENQFALDPTDTYGLNFGVEKIFGGETFTCALTDRGFAKCWGSFHNQQPVLSPRRVYAP